MKKEKPQTQHGFFTIRAMILTIATVIFCSALVNIELDGWNTYASSYAARIGFYKKKLDSLTKIRSWDDRMFMRHVANVEIPKYVVKNKLPTDTVLLPPIEYADKYLRVRGVWTDPRIFAYMVGFHPVIPYSDVKRRSQANTYVVLDANQIWLARRGGATNIDSLLMVYKAVSGK